MSHKLLLVSVGCTRSFPCRPSFRQTRHRRADWRRARTLTGHGSWWSCSATTTINQALPPPRSSLSRCFFGLSRFGAHSWFGRVHQRGKTPVSALPPPDPAGRCCFRAYPVPVPAKAVLSQCHGPLCLGLVDVSQSHRGARTTTACQGLWVFVR